MYEAMTRGIRVRVEPHYDEVRSEPANQRYFWLYEVEIRNEGAEPVQLMTRHWQITDGNGVMERVDGPGVVGKTPAIAPGEAFAYTSGCPLTTPSGIMVGAYQMALANGEHFKVDIPAFSLDSPFVQKTVN